MFLVISGILLLLPGLCTGIVFFSELKKPNVTLPTFVTLLLGTGLVGAALVVLGIVIGLRGLARRR